MFEESDKAGVLPIEKHVAQIDPKVGLKVGFADNRFIVSNIDTMQIDIIYQIVVGEFGSADNDILSWIDQTWPQGGSTALTPSD